MKKILSFMPLFLSLLLIQATSLKGFDDISLSQYTEAEKATNKENRQKLFNQALEGYLNLPSAKTSAVVNYNIANCYFQLNEYGIAIFYYNRALVLNPRLAKASDNLEIAYKKIGLPPPKTSLISTLLFFHSDFSTFERKMLLLGSTLFSLVFASLFLWLRVKIFQTVCFLTLTCSIFFFISILWSLFLSPVEAIIIQPTHLQKDAGYQYAAISTINPLYGQKVKVIDTDSKTGWLKVELDSGQQGFVTKEQARII